MSVVVAIAVIMTSVVAVVPVAVVPVVLDRGAVGGGVGAGVTASSDGGGVGDPCTGVAGDVDLQGDGRVAVPGRQDGAACTGEGGQNAVPSPAGDPVGPKACGENVVDDDRGAIGRAGRGDVTHSDGVNAVLAPGEDARRLVNSLAKNNESLGRPRSAVSGLFGKWGRSLRPWPPALERSCRSTPRGWT